MQPCDLQSATCVIACESPAPHSRWGVVADADVVVEVVLLARGHCTGHLLRRFVQDLLGVRTVVSGVSAIHLAVVCNARRVDVKQHVRSWSI